LPDKPKILIVDDDPNILQVVGYALRKAGYEIVCAKDGKEAVEVFTTASPNLVVLDILMPEMDGTDVCRKIRSMSKVPVIFLSSKDDEVDRIIGLELGGDDYITKPFSPRELIARIRAVLRRTAESSDRESSPAPPNGPARLMERGRLKLDLDGYRAFWMDREIILTATEFGMIKTLLSFPGKVYTRDELMSRAYHLDTVVSDRTIDSHIRHIRDKFKAVGGTPIDTVHGIGYRISSCI